VREDDDAPASGDRQEGFLDGLARAGLPGGPDAVLRCVDPVAELTADRVRALVTDGVTAFVAEETDTGAAWRAVSGAVRAAGLSCPQDVSLALLGSPPPDLAREPVPMGFDVPRHALGAAAVRLLASMVAGEEADEPLVACEVRDGVTAGPRVGQLP
jgi:DNA-binding LacI/PurR family transcriptional regulator